MRNMSFALTEPQIMDRTKTVTRRLQWENLKPGTKLQAVRKAMGLRKGERMVRLETIETIDVRREPLNVITPEDVAREGYPGETPSQFVVRFCGAMHCDPDQEITRIEFTYAGPAIRCFRFPGTADRLLEIRSGQRRNAVAPFDPTLTPRTGDRMRFELAGSLLRDTPPEVIPGGESIWVTVEHAWNLKHPWADKLLYEVAWKPESVHWWPGEKAGRTKAQSVKE